MTEVVSNIKAPDVSEVTAAHKQVTASVDEAKASVGAMEKAILMETDTLAKQVAAVRAVVEALPRESEERKQAAAMLTQAIMLREREAAAIREQAKAAKEAQAHAVLVDAGQERFKEIAVLERLAAYRRNAAEEEVANQARIGDAQRRAMLQTGAAMAAALQFGKGIALLSASTEEETQKIMKQIVAIQGYYDVAHGGVMVISNLAGAWKAVQAAAIAAGAAQAVALGPVALAAAAVAATLYMLHSTFDVFRVKSHEALEQGKKMAEFHMDFLEKVRAMRQHEATTRDSAMDTYAERVIKIKTVNANEGDALGIKLVETEKLRAETMREINQRKQEGFGYDERSAELEKRLATQDEKRFDIQKQITAELRSQLKATEDQIRAADTELKMAHEKERSAEIALGHLNKSELGRLKRLNAKVGAGGKLTDHELKDLSRLGGEAVKPYVDKQYRERGIAAGGLGIISNVGGKDARDNTRRKTGEVDRLENFRSEQEQRLQEEEKKLQQKADDLEKSAKTAFDGVFKMFDHLAAEFLNVQREAQRRVRAS